MQYLLLLYANEAGWEKMTPAEQKQGVAAYQAFTEALTKAGVFEELESAAAGLDCDDRSHRGRQIASVGWPLR